MQYRILHRIGKQGVELKRIFVFNDKIIHGSMESVFAFSNYSEVSLMRCRFQDNHHINEPLVTFESPKLSFIIFMRYLFIYLFILKVSFFTIYHFN